MSRRSSPYLAGAVFALCAVAGAAAFAQPPAPPPGPEAQGSAPHHHMMAMGHEQEHRDPTAHLRAILQLRPNQEAALTAFVAAMKPTEADERMMRMMHGDEAKAWPKTTPERLAMMQKAMDEHVARAKARMEAVRVFYDQLDTAQKKAFDELPPMMMMHGHEGPRHHTEMKHDEMKHDGGREHPPMPPAPMAPAAPRS